MNAKQRKEIATQLADIATKAGATVEIAPERARLGSRALYSIRFEASFADVKVSIDIDNLHHGGVCAHWYDAGRPLALVSPLGEPNTVHRRKATLYRSTSSLFVQAFAKACEAIVSGAAFDDAWKPAPRAA